MIRLNTNTMVFYTFACGIKTYSYGLAMYVIDKKQARFLNLHLLIFRVT